ncbi:hypothetical protein GGR22_001289 [Flavobacterium gossypii]|uniref:GDYXXLXY protein n=1 Tax=Flavobacterium gossypii TaxID=1646119 RepID=A0ABR6DP07_9FLAO|nr:hypothetical protein [Flavobacterium gossypii]MBA9073163.1 hypothetical protein [Flavobacterium gossypii]
MKKKTVSIVILIILFLVFALYFSPWVKKPNKEIIYVEYNDSLTFNPLQNIDFNVGDNKAYLLISHQDIEELPDGIKKGKVLFCSDNNVLDRLAKNFYHKKSGGDMATCESEILIYHNKKLILSSKIALSKNIIGLQGESIGWADAVNRDSLVSVFKEFNLIKRPVLILE